jgi:hypothetical protein
MKGLTMGITLSLSLANATFINSISKFKQLDYRLTKKEISIAEFKKLDYLLCKDMKDNN